MTNPTGVESGSGGLPPCSFVCHEIAPESFGLQPIDSGNYRPAIAGPTKQDRLRTRLCSGRSTCCFQSWRSSSRRRTHGSGSV